MAACLHALGRGKTSSGRWAARPVRCLASAPALLVNGKGESSRKWNLWIIHSLGTKPAFPRLVSCAAAPPFGLSLGLTQAAQRARSCFLAEAEATLDRAPACCLSWLRACSCVCPAFVCRSASVWMRADEGEPLWLWLVFRDVTVISQSGLLLAAALSHYSCKLWIIVTCKVTLCVGDVSKRRVKTWNVERKEYINLHVVYYIFFRYV